MAAGTSGRGGVITYEHVLWAQWARIALAEASASEAAQSRRTGVGNSDDSTAFGESVDRGLVAVCSAAFSMEAMSRDLAAIAIDGQMLAAWKRNQTAASDVLFETLKRSLDLTQDTVRALVNGFEPVIEKRGRAVHYKSVVESPVPLADGSFSTTIVRDFGLDSARDAVNAMRAIYAAILDHPKRNVMAFVAKSESALRDAVGR